MGAGGLMDPLAFVCPQCHAAVGAKCKNYNDKGCAPHRQRMAAMREAARPLVACVPHAERCAFPGCYQRGTEEVQGLPSLGPDDRLCEKHAKMLRRSQGLQAQIGLPLPTHAEVAAERERQALEMAAAAAAAPVAAEHVALFEDGQHQVLVAGLPVPVDELPWDRAEAEQAAELCEVCHQRPRRPGGKRCVQCALQAMEWERELRDQEAVDAERERLRALAAALPGRRAKPAAPVLSIQDPRALARACRVCGSKPTGELHKCCPRRCGATADGPEEAGRVFGFRRLRPGGPQTLQSQCKRCRAKRPAKEARARTARARRQRSK